MKPAKNFLLRLTLVGFFLWLGCGSGGGGSGGGDESDPADVSLQVSPDVLDTGDRSTIRISVSDWRDPEIALKVRLPKALSYVSGSSLFAENEKLYDIDPAATATDDNYLYLLYYLNRFDLGSIEWGVLSLKVLALSNLPAGDIAVDVDFYDSYTDSGQPFTAENVLFEAQSEEYVRVGPAPSPSPTASK